MPRSLDVVDIGIVAEGFRLMARSLEKYGSDQWARNDITDHQYELMRKVRAEFAWLHLWDYDDDGQIVVAYCFAACWAETELHTDKADEALAVILDYIKFPWSEKKAKAMLAYETLKEELA